MSTGNGYGRIDPIAMHRLRELTANQISLRGDFLRRYLDPRRDIDAECGYKDTRSISPQDYRELYEREAIAARVVEVLPKESWQTLPEVYEDESIDVITDFERAWNSLGSQLHSYTGYRGDGSPIWEWLRRVDILSGIGHFGVLLLGVDDLSPGDSLAVPIKGFDSGSPSRKPRKLLFLRAFDESLVNIVQWERDQSSPRYGLPKVYQLTLNDPMQQTGIGIPLSTVQVHWSRIIHVADNLGSSEIFGTPRMRPVFNRLMDLRKLYSGSAEMYWKAAFMGLSFETHPQIAGDVSIDAEAVRQAAERYQNTLQRFLVTEGMTVKSLAPQVSDPVSQIMVQIEAICIEKGIPKRVFMGSERGELASSQDDAAWNDRLRERRIGYLTPRLIVPFIDRLIQIGILPRPEGYSVFWPELESVTEAERASIAETRTRTMAAYIAGQVDALVPPLDFLVRFAGMNRDEAQSVLEASVERMQSDELPDDGQDEEKPVNNIVRKLPNGKYRLYSRDGRNLGTFDSLEDARRHEREIDYFRTNSLCGAGTEGSPGFQPGNTCAKGDGGGMVIENPPYRGKITMTEAEELLKAVKVKGGFTYQPVDDSSPESGYSVGVFPEGERTFDLESIRASDIFRFLQDNADKFDTPDLHCGGWIDEGKVYLDVSKVTDSLEEAVSLGVHHNQYSIFDLARKQSIEVPSQRTLEKYRVQRAKVGNREAERENRRGAEEQGHRPVQATDGARSIAGRSRGDGSPGDGVRSPARPQINSECGAGEPGNPGFQPGNTCAKGSQESLSEAQSLFKLVEKLRERDKNHVPQGSHGSASNEFSGDKRKARQAVQSAIQQLQDGPTKEEYLSALKEVWGKMTPEAKQRMASNLRSVEVYEDNLDLTVSVTRELPDHEIVQNGITPDNRIGGVYYNQHSWDKKGHLKLDGRLVHGDGELVEWAKDAVDTFSHEFAHVIDGPANELSKRERWLSVSEKEILQVKYEMINGYYVAVPALTSYAHWSPQEAFAEFYRLAITERERARLDFPECWKFFSDHKLVK